MYRTLITALLIMACHILALAQPHHIFTDSKEAFSIAQKHHLPVLLVFSGSDWCASCIRFEKKVLQKQAFHKFMNGKFIVLKSDFPQKNTQTKSQKRQNEELAELFNPQGLFPAIVLLSANKEKLAFLEYANQDLHTFNNELLKWL